MSSIFAFFTASLLIEACLYIFRIRNPRFRSIFRLFPYLNLCADLIFTNLRLGNWINPLSCESCFQKLILKIVPFEIQTEIAAKKLSFAEYIALQIPIFWLQGIFALFVLISLGILLRKIIQFFYFTHSLNHIVEFSKLSSRPLFNQQLQNTLQTSKAKILVSSQIMVPLAAQKHLILIPAVFHEELSQEEYEAVIAHELEHLRWRDPAVNFTAKIISSLFWWVPTNWWFKKMEEEQEKACDQRIISYQLDNCSLASAILKISSRIKSLGGSAAAICHFAANSNSPLSRVQTILGISTTSPLNRVFLSFAAAASLIAISCLL